MVCWKTTQFLILSFEEIEYDPFLQSEEDEFGAANDGLRRQQTKYSKTMADIVQRVSDIDPLSLIQIFPHTFSKNNESNYHIDFMTVTHISISERLELLSLTELDCFIFFKSVRFCNQISQTI